MCSEVQRLRSFLAKEARRLCSRCLEFAPLRESVLTGHATRTSSWPSRELLAGLNQQQRDLLTPLRHIGPRSGQHGRALTPVSNPDHSRAERDRARSEWPCSRILLPGCSLAVSSLAARRSAGFRVLHELQKNSD